MKTKKENMIAALECRQPADFVPIWELEFQAWDNASNRHVILGTEFTTLSEKEKETAINENAEIMLEVCEKFHFSALSMVGNYWEIAPGHPSYYWITEEWKLKQNALLQRYCEKEGIATLANSGGFMGMPGSSANYEEFCYMVIDEPEKIDEMAIGAYEYGINNVKKFCDLGYDILINAADIADNKGCFYSPAQMERWIFPYLYKWAEEIKKSGMYSIMHTDGNVNSVLDILADSDLHALQAIDPVAGMNMKEAKDRVAGRLCLCGNIETGLLMTGPKETIYENTRVLLEECKVGGGLVLGASNASVPETPCENYMQLVKAWKEYGQYN